MRSTVQNILVIAYTHFMEMENISCKMAGAGAVAAIAKNKTFQRLKKMVICVSTFVRI